jgi:hypothetical protein
MARVMVFSSWYIYCLKINNKFDKNFTGLQVSQLSYMLLSLHSEIKRDKRFLHTPNTPSQFLFFSETKTHGSVSASTMCLV